MYAASPDATSARSADDDGQSAGESSRRIVPGYPASRAASAVVVSTTAGAESSSMNASRSAGYSGSSGTYAAPDLTLASSATTRSSDRSAQTPTSAPGPAPAAR